ERIGRRAILGAVPPADSDNPSPSPSAIRVYDSETATAVVARSDLVAILPRRLAAARAEQAGLYLFDTPTDVPGPELALLSHRRFNEDPGLAWLRGLIVDVSRFDAAPGQAGTGPSISRPSRSDPRGSSFNR